MTRSRESNDTRFRNARAIKRQGGRPAHGQSRIDRLQQLRWKVESFRQDTRLSRPSPGRVEQRVRRSITLRREGADATRCDR